MELTSTTPLRNTRLPGTVLSMQLNSISLRSVVQFPIRGTVFEFFPTEYRRIRVKFKRRRGLFGFRCAMHSERKYKLYRTELQSER